jgi:lysophospholipase L1-like esterase
MITSVLAEYADMKRDWWNKEFKSLLTLGASTTAGGWSSCRDRCWASLLPGMINELQRHPVQLTNMGVGANVISTKSRGYAYSGKPAASERLDKHVLENTANGAPIVPDLLIIAYGLNDARGGTPVYLFSDEMKNIIRRVRKRIQPLIVLLGPYYMSDFTIGGKEWSHADLETFHRYNDATSRVAETCDCLFVDLLESYHSADWLVHHDGCHANDLGHRLVANKIFEVLASNCSGLALETRHLEKSILPWRDESTLQA